MTDDSFVEMVEKKMEAINDDFAFNQTGDQFAVWFGSEILGLPVTDVADKYHIGGAGDEKVDIGICESGIPLKTIVQCKYRSGGQETFDEGPVEEVIKAKKKNMADCTNGNNKRQKFCGEFRASNQPERLLAAGFGPFNDAAYRLALANGIVIYDLKRIRNEWFVRNDPTRLSKPDLIRLPMSKEDLIQRKHESREVYMTVISTHTLYELIEEHGLKLFGENFRYKLPSSARSDEIAYDIQQTLEIHPARMLQRNNGLTFTAERVDIDDDALELIQPQIVNGCQTSYAIHEWYQQRAAVHSLVDLPEAELSTKIVVSESDEAKSIARSANRQNPIGERDLHANDQEQIELSSSFHSLSPKIYYETREGGWAAVAEKNETRYYKHPDYERFRRITNEECGQIELALFCLPHYSKDRKREIWSNSDIYHAIFGVLGDHPDRMDSIKDLTLIQQCLNMFKASKKVFANDCLFGFGFLSLLDSVRVKLLKEKARLWDNPEDDPVGKVVKKKTDYYNYWEYHVLALVNFVIWSICHGDRSKMEKARKALIGDDLNLFFSTPTKRADKFILLEDNGFHDILGADLSDSSKLGYLSTWLNTIDGIFLDLIEAAENDGTFKNYNRFFYKTSSTFEKAIDKVARVFGSITRRQSQFPLP